jgi:tetratricopeptide (TPR) repeat protein
VLALAGLPQPPGLDGRPLVSGVSTAAPVAYVETMYSFLDFGAAPVSAASDGRYKVIDVPLREVYDLRADPAEARNLADQDPVPQVAALRAALAELPGPPQLPSQKTDEDEAKALRSLGYIGAGGEYAVGRVGMDPKQFAPIYRKLVAVRDLCGARRFAEAVPLYTELLAAFPRSSAIACELGLVEMALGRPTEAESHLRRALDLNPDNSHALLGMANLAIGRRDYQAAEGHLLAVLTLDPDDLEAASIWALYFRAQSTREGLAIGGARGAAAGRPRAPRIRKLLEDVGGGQAKAAR